MSHVHRFLWLGIALLAGCAQPEIRLTNPVLEPIYATGIVLLIVCDRKRDLLIIYSDGSYKIMSKASPDELLLIGPRVGGIDPDAWFYSHPRLCGLTPL